MKIKHFKLKSTIVASTAVLLFVAVAPNAFAFTEQQSTTSQDKISVNIKQIKELSNMSFDTGEIQSNKNIKLLV